MPKKQLTGNIISNKMQKTVVVRVERLKEHPKYKRRFRVHKNYKAHVYEGEY
ncbi:MAG: 30S ribosomal protein S17, partial [Candidatus Nealsonbacteria bacterium]|nr:30S ribosomal protein S17 [Candidatus Nealsonbacteria bacterium]